MLFLGFFVVSIYCIGVCTFINIKSRMSSSSASSSSSLASASASVSASASSSLCSSSSSEDEVEERPAEVFSLKEEEVLQVDDNLPAEVVVVAASDAAVAVGGNKSDVEDEQDDAYEE